jgi:hypothetical protein
MRNSFAKTEAANGTCGLPQGGDHKKKSVPRMGEAQH